MTNNNKYKYDKEYVKAHYTTLRADFKKDTAEAVKSYCKDMNISVSSYIQMCCKYCIDNIPLQELKDYLKYND